MKRFFKVYAACSALALPFVANAQDKVEVTVGADLVSGYIWRGQDLGGAAIQPSVGVAYKGISLSAWGSYGLTGKEATKELDFTLSYSVGNFTVGITDYFCVSGTSNCPVKYFLYDSDRTAHVFEANVGYDFGILSLNWFTNFAGADGVNKSGKRAYSSYVEIGVPFKLGGINWEATLAAVPYATDYYADASGFAVTNVSVKASKEINITSTFSLPLFAALTANPSTQSLYFTAGISF